MNTIKLLIFSLVFGNTFSKDVQDNPWIEPASKPEPGRVFEGDIMLTEIDIAFMNGDLQGDARIGRRYQWSNAVIPYTIKSLNRKGRTAISQAIAEYHKKTCVKFRPRQNNERNYIEFFAGRGCYSNIGRVGGKQKISLGRGCGYKRTAVHEMLHALGFWHEQSRTDRNKYIKIITANIIGGRHHNFNIHRSTAYGQPYDYDSVMHYRNKAFSKNGQQTIQAINYPTRNFGQPTNGGLSVIDAKQVNAHYKCKDVSTSKKPKSCVDKHPFCMILFKNNFCGTDWVKLNCRKSCSQGKDIHRHCKYWTSRGYCTGQYEKFMRKNCKKSCKIGTEIC